MALDDNAVGKALNALFPSKRYAPHRSDDTGCPPPPPVEDEGGDQ